jgi:hypothetical protein
LLLAQVVQAVVVHTVKAEMQEATQVLILLCQQAAVVVLMLGMAMDLLVVQVVAVLVLMSTHQHLVVLEIHLQPHLLKEIMEEEAPMVVVTNMQAVEVEALAQWAELQQLQLLVAAE